MGRGGGVGSSSGRSSGDGGRRGELGGFARKLWHCLRSYSCVLGTLNCNCVCSKLAYSVE